MFYYLLTIDHYLSSLWEKLTSNDAIAVVAWLSLVVGTAAGLIAVLAWLSPRPAITRRPKLRKDIDAKITTPIYYHEWVDFEKLKNSFLNIRLKEFEEKYNKKKKNSSPLPFAYDIDFSLENRVPYEDRLEEYETQLHDWETELVPDEFIDNFLALTLDRAQKIETFKICVKNFSKFTIENISIRVVLDNRLVKFIDYQNPPSWEDVSPPVYSDRNNVYDTLSRVARDYKYATPTTDYCKVTHENERMFLDFEESVTILPTESETLDSYGILVSQSDEPFIEAEIEIKGRFKGVIKMPIRIVVVNNDRG